MPARRLPPVLRSPLHRVPVRWSLYRPLLRAARSVDLELPEQAATALSAYIKNGFRQNRRLGAIEPVRRKLREAEQVRPLDPGAVSLETDYRVSNRF